VAHVSSPSWRDHKRASRLSEPISAHNNTIAAPRMGPLCAGDDAAPANSRRARVAMDSESDLELEFELELELELELEFGAKPT